MPLLSIPPTAKQLALHRWMLVFQQAEHMPPTLGDICTAFGFASKYTAVCHLVALEKRGLVVHREGPRKGSSRSWRAVQPPGGPSE